MLQTLSIRDFVIVDALSIEFERHGSATTQRVIEHKVDRPQIRKLIALYLTKAESGKVLLNPILR